MGNMIVVEVNSYFLELVDVRIFCVLIVLWVLFGFIFVGLNFFVCVMVIFNKKFCIMINYFVFSLFIFDLMVVVVFVFVYIIDYYVKIVIVGYFVVFVLLIMVFNFCGVMYECYIVLI